MKKKDKIENDFSQLPTSVAEFVKLVIKKMRYRKKIRKDVQAELVAHFEDELKNCKTSEERDQRAEQLIADFGDAKLLAVLLRRSKKRCRPLWRTIIARTCQAIVILFVCLILYIVWFLSGKPVITTDYVAQLNRMVRPVADESLNAAPFYSKAVELYGKPSDDFLLFFAESYDKIADEEFPSIEKEIADEIHKLFLCPDPNKVAKNRQRIEKTLAKRLYILLRKGYHDSTVRQRSIIEKWIEDQKQSFDLLIAGTRKPYYWQEYGTGDEYTGEMMAVVMPNLGGFRESTYALRWRAQLSAEKGRYENAFADLKSSYLLGRHLKGANVVLIEQLVGISTEARAVQTIRDILNNYQIDSSILATLQKDFEAMIADEDFVAGLEGEKLFMYDEIQRCFTEDPLGGHICLEGLRRIRLLSGSDPLDYIVREKAWTAPLHVLFTHPNKRQSIEMVDRFYVFCEKMAQKTPAQLHKENMDFNKQAMEMVKGNILLEILTPALGRVAEIAHRAKVDVLATVTIIALLRYELDKAAYPVSLDELVKAGYLKEVSTDPFSDKPLVYKKTDDNFMLYSVGRDFVDDGGKVVRDVEGKVERWPDKGDFVFWPVQKQKPSK